MEAKEPRPLIPAAAIIAAVVLLPVAFIIAGFNLVPLMAITAGSRTAWLVVLAAIALAVIFGAGYVARMRRKV